MAIYTYRCPSGHATERRRDHASRNAPLVCGTCSSQMKRDEIERAGFAIGSAEARKAPPPIPIQERSKPGGLTILRGNTFANAEIGIKMDGGVLDADGNTFSNQQVIVAKNAVVRMRNTKVKKSK
jgi:hypothetical protein